MLPDGTSAGFDDAPHSAYLTPSLTTVRLDFTGLGRAAAGKPPEEYVEFLP